MDIQETAPIHWCHAYASRAPVALTPWFEPGENLQKATSDYTQSHSNGRISTRAAYDWGYTIHCSCSYIASSLNSRSSRLEACRARGGCAWFPVKLSRTIGNVLIVVLTQQVAWVHTIVYGEHDLTKNCTQPPLMLHRAPAMMVTPPYHRARAVNKIMHEKFY